VQKTKKKGFNFVGILVAWWIWKHMNAYVFDAASQSINTRLQNIQDDANLWGIAGAIALRRLWV
jgi:aryl-phospho-beta-D-glucosidase BglC (GH1 family)